MTLVVLPTGPVVLEQLMPETPVTDQVPVPVGVWPPDGPVTVAEKVKGEPRATVGELVVTKTVGAAFATLIEYAALKA
jgi:hypothetical protein